MPTCDLIAAGDIPSTRTFLAYTLGPSEGGYYEPLLGADLDEALERYWAVVAREDLGHGIVRGAVGGVIERTTSIPTDGPWWVAAQSIVEDGSVIGDGVFVGAGITVTRSVLRGDIHLTGIGFVEDSTLEGTQRYHHRLTSIARSHLSGTILTRPEERGMLTMRDVTLVGGTDDAPQRLEGSCRLLSTRIDGPATVRYTRTVRSVVEGAPLLDDARLDGAHVTGSPTIAGTVAHSTIAEAATVESGAHVSGGARIDGHARIAGTVEGGAHVGDDARVRATGRITGEVELLDAVDVAGTVRGPIVLVGGDTIAHNTVLDGREDTVDDDPDFPRPSEPGPRRGPTPGGAR